MNWSDVGIVVSARAHGEHAAIVGLLTRAHGRHQGLARGGKGRRARGLYELGNVVAADWRARLDEHLGAYTAELTLAHAARRFADPPRLAAIASACALIDRLLPERDPHPVLYDRTVSLLAELDAVDWPARYVAWEVALLAELGFGLDLSRCAATGRNDALAYVSPRTGRAVSLSAGEAYRDRLLALPRFLTDAATPAEPPDIARGLALTGFFLDKLVAGDPPRPPPAARARLVERLARLDAPHGAATIPVER